MNTVRMGLFTKKPEWSIGDFRNHWLNKHGPLVKKAPGLSRYWQNHVVDREQRGIDFARDPWEFDGLSQLWISDPQNPFGEGELPQRIREDELHFMGKLHIVTVNQTEVIEVPDAAIRANLKKRMSLIRRQPGLSDEDFLAEWTAHGDLVRAMPGVKGYRQNAVIQRELEKGHVCSYDDLPIDGIVEFWFDSAESLDEAFRSEAGLKAMEHAKTFLAGITAFLVEEHRII